MDGMDGGGLKISGGGNIVVLLSYFSGCSISPGVWVSRTCLPCLYYVHGNVLFVCLLFTFFLFLR